MSHQIEPQPGRGATNPPLPDAGQGDTAENPPTGLTARLVTANAEAHRQERVRSLRDTGKSASDEAQAAKGVAAVLRALADHDCTWTDTDLERLADEIDANTTHQENP